MPIGTIIAQPASNGISAAYRPVILGVTASSANPDETARPPVVYCDIYFNDVYYKTISKMVYASVGVSSSTWQFDIQDAAQEYLKRFLAVCGYPSIVEATTIIVKTFCKFRSSQTDSDGFIEPEGSAPVQATAETPAISGDGTQSNTFYIVNATLQHEENQDLAQHLDYFKRRTWSGEAYPLSHRPDGYIQAQSDSDFFPIIYLGEQSFKTLRLNYRFVGQSTVRQASVNILPAPTCNAIISGLTVSHVGSSYGVSWSLVSGSPVKYYISTPAISGGAPAESITTSHSFGSSLPPGSHVVTVAPMCYIGGEYYLGTSQSVTIVVEAPPVCVGVGYNEMSVLPDAEVGESYSYILPLTGTSPFSISSIIKPSWMTISVVGSQVQFSGTPTETAVSVAVSFDISNCSGANSISFDDVIDVIETAPGEGEFKITNTAAGFAIASISPAFYTLNPTSGDFPFTTLETGEGDHEGTGDPISVGITGSGFESQLHLIVNGTIVQTKTVGAAGTYAFDAIAISSTDNVEIKLETV